MLSSSDDDNDNENDDSYGGDNFDSMPMNDDDMPMESLPADDDAAADDDDRGSLADSFQPPPEILNSSAISPEFDALGSFVKSRPASNTVSQHSVVMIDSDSDDNNYAAASVVDLVVDVDADIDGDGNVDVDTSYGFEGDKLASTSAALVAGRDGNNTDADHVGGSTAYNGDTDIDAHCVGGAGGYNAASDQLEADMIAAAVKVEAEAGIRAAGGGGGGGGGGRAAQATARVGLAGLAGGGGGGGPADADNADVDAGETIVCEGRSFQVGQLCITRNLTSEGANGHFFNVINWDQYAGIGWVELPNRVPVAVLGVL